MSEPKSTQPQDEDDALAVAVESGLESLDAGRSLPYEDVRRWLLSWGTDQELPPPVCP